MGSNRFISWTAFTLFVLAIVIVVLVVFAPTLAPFGLLMSEAAVWVISVLALLSAILGFIAFRTSQGKIAAFGGEMLMLTVLYITQTATVVLR